MEQSSASLPFAVIEAPSNLGLCPPETGAVPGADHEIGLDRGTVVEEGERIVGRRRGMWNHVGDKHAFDRT